MYQVHLEPKSILSGFLNLAVLQVGAPIFFEIAAKIVVYDFEAGDVFDLVVVNDDDDDDDDDDDNDDDISDIFVAAFGLNLLLTRVFCIQIR